MQVVVSVDPAGSGRIDRDAIGVIVAALDDRGHVYVLADASVPGCQPEQWGRHVVDVYRMYGAGSVLLEQNQGGVLNDFAVRQAAGGSHVHISGVHARGSKYDRALRTIGVLAPQGRLHHVGELPELEREMTSFTGAASRPIGSMH